MKYIASDQWNWIWVIGLILLPLAIIHSFEHEIIPRLIFTLLIFLVVPGLLFVTLRSNTKFISDIPNLKQKYSELILKKWDIVFKLFFLGFAVLVLYQVTFPLLGGTYRFVIKQESLMTIEGSVENQQSVFGAIFLYWRFDVKETGNHLYFFYPNVIRSTGEKYQFIVLPGTNFVLDSKGK